MTHTAKITFRWADRNRIGEPLPITRHGLEWTEDDGITLAKLSDAVVRPETPAFSTTDKPATWADAGKFILRLAVASFALKGMVDLLQAIGAHFQ